MYYSFANTFSALSNESTDAYKKSTNLRAIAGLYTEACQLVVQAHSDIYSLADLEGHSSGLSG